MTKEIVLIVDDEPVNIHSVVQILHDKYELKVATSAKIALEIIDTYKPDLILLDINMPVMDGYEMAKILKNNEENQSIPFIAYADHIRTASRLTSGHSAEVDSYTLPIYIRTI